MKVNTLYKTITDYCRKNKNESTIKKYSRYFKDGYDAYGLMQEKINEITETILKSDGFNLASALKLSTSLLKSKKYEETFLAIRFVKHFGDKFTKATFSEVSKWFDYGIVNWAHNDVLCGTLMTLFIDKKLISLKDLAPWRTSSQKYKRRAVPVTMLHFNKLKGNGFGDMFKFIDPMMMDEERVVQQGLGWFLREAWKKNSAETEKFLMKWKDKAPRLIFQYATEKMTPAGKKKFKRG